MILRNFQIKNKKNEQKNLIYLLKKINKLNSPDFIKSFKSQYKYSYKKKILNKYKNHNFINIIGMGGSSLGVKAIYNFLINKIKKKFKFQDNLDLKKENKNKSLNIIISKSGNTLETIVNLNSKIKKNKNLFITENTNNYLRKLANKLKSDVIDHKNYIGGRFSVLSEVGMLPAQLMGLNERKFKQFNNLIIKPKFLKDLTNNVLSMYKLIKMKKFNSVI